MRKSLNYHKDRIFLTYIIFCVIRVVLVFVPQHGIIHPDEFFQSVEPMAGKNNFALHLIAQNSHILTQHPPSR